MTLKEFLDRANPDMIIRVVDDDEIISENTVQNTLNDLQTKKMLVDYFDICTNGIVVYVTGDI